MKRMKKYGLCWILAATMIASFAVTGCDMKLDDEENRAAVQGSKSEGNTGTSDEKKYPDAVVSLALNGKDEGVKIVGNGTYVDDATFEKVFKNDGSASRTSYLLLPSDTLKHSATSKEMTIGFWVNANDVKTDWLPMFAAYGAAPVDGKNTFPMFMCQSRCKLQVNCAGYCDFTLDYLKDKIADYNTTDVNLGYSGWKDNNWHYYTCTLTDKTGTIYIDGTLIASWTVDGTSDGQKIDGMFTSTELSYVCLGGNQAWDWADNDAPYSFAKFSVWDKALTVEQIKAVVASK